MSTLHAFGDAGRIDIDMDNLLRLLEKFGRYGNHTVVKTRTYGKNDIRILHGKVCLVSTVHTEHTEDWRSPEG